MSENNSRKHGSDATHEQVKALLIDASDERASILKRALVDNDCMLLKRLHDAEFLMKNIDLYLPDIIVVGVDLPDTQMLERLSDVNRYCPLPVVMFAEKDTPKIIRQTVKAGVSAFVVDDIQPARLGSIIDVAIARFKEYQGLKQELEKTRTKLEERKILERAKGMLMEQKNMSEEEAYASLRKMAMDKGQTLAVIAQNIIDVLGLLDAEKAR